MRLFFLALLLSLASPVYGAISVPSASKDMLRHINANGQNIYKVLKLYIQDSDGSNTMVVEAPDLADDNTVFRVPADNGTNKQCLITNGSGVTAWESLLHGTHVDNPTTSVHGVTGTVVGTSDSQTLTNKTVDVEANSFTNITDAHIKATAQITRTKLKTGTADHVLINDGSGDVSSEAQLANSRGGTGTDSSGDTGVARVTSGTWTYDSGMTHLSDIGEPASACSTGEVLKKDAGGTMLCGVDNASAVNIDIVAFATDTTILDADGYRTFLCDASSADVTFTLPTLSDNDERIITMKKVDTSTNSCILDGEGAETIDGLANETIDAPGIAVTVHGLGTDEWHSTDRPKFYPPFVSAQTGAYAATTSWANAGNGYSVTVPEAGWYRLVAEGTLLAREDGGTSCFTQARLYDGSAVIPNTERIHRQTGDAVAATNISMAPFHIEVTVYLAASTTVTLQAQEDTGDSGEIGYNAGGFTGFLSYQRVN